MVLLALPLPLLHNTSYIFKGESLWALHPLRTTSNIDKGEASIILLALWPLHTTSYIDKGEASIILYALRPLHTTSYIDKGEASIIETREVVSWDRIRKLQSSTRSSFDKRGWKLVTTSTEVASTPTLLHTFAHILCGNLTNSSARLNQFFIAASDDAVHTKWIKLLRIVLQLAT